MASTLSFPITFSLAPLSTGQSLDANAYGQALIANLQASISGAFLTGQIGGSMPTQDVGPWANNGHWWFWDPVSQTYVQESLTSNFPTGCFIPFGGTSAPTGFVFCDGALYLRTGTMGALFAVIGTKYGVGDGSSTFNVPDFRGRTPVGAGTGPAVSGVNPILTPRAIGDRFGVETYALLPTELASHNHLQDPHNHTQNAHNHIQDVHNHAQNAHNHTQDVHNHSQNAHNHTQDFHNHTQDSHNHLQNAHNHTQNPHNHSILDQTVATGASGGVIFGQNGINFNVTGTTTAVNQAQTAINVATTATNQGVVATNQAQTATNIAVVATNQAQTAVNVAVVATNQAQTAVNVATTATNQFAGSNVAHQNIQPSLVCQWIVKI